MLYHIITASECFPSVFRFLCRLLKDEKQFSHIILIILQSVRSVIIIISATTHIQSRPAFVKTSSHPDFAPKFTNSISLIAVLRADLRTLSSSSFSIKIPTSVSRS